MTAQSISRQFDRSCEECLTVIQSMACEIDRCRAEAEDGPTLAQLKRMISFKAPLRQAINRMMDSYDDITRLLDDRAHSTKLAGNRPVEERFSNALRTAVELARKVADHCESMPIGSDAADALATIREELGIKD